jgi:ribosomal protein S18 acetylase RimI-like enzyme
LAGTRTRIVPSVPDGEIPLARLLAHEADYFATMASVERRDGWLLFHNRAFPTRYNPNHAGVFRAAEGTGPSIALEIVAFYRGLGITPVAHVDALATPADLAACLLDAGFRRQDEEEPADLMLYVGPDQERVSVSAVERVSSAEGRRDWASIIDEHRPAETRTLLAALYEHQLRDRCVTGYVSRVDGVPAARANLFSANSLGRVESVFTRESFRRRGLAAAVVRRAVRDSLDRGNCLTYIHAVHGGDAQRLYERLGFRSVASDGVRVYALTRADT